MNINIWNTYQNINILWKQRLETSGLEPKLAECKFVVLLIKLYFFLKKKYYKTLLNPYNKENVWLPRQPKIIFVHIPSRIIKL